VRIAHMIDRRSKVRIAHMIDRRSKVRIAHMIDRRSKVRIAHIIDRRKLNHNKIASCEKVCLTPDETGKNFTSAGDFYLT